MSFSVKCSFLDFRLHLYVYSFRLESYSCKLIVQEKRLLKALGGSPNEREILSPPASELYLQQPSPQHLSRSVSSDHGDEVSQIFTVQKMSFSTLACLGGTA